MVVLYVRLRLYFDTSLLRLTLECSYSGQDRTHRLPCMGGLAAMYEVYLLGFFFQYGGLVVSHPGPTPLPSPSCLPAASSVAVFFFYQT